MGVLCRKIWRDLWENKARTLQVVLIIGMGAFAIGMIIGTRDFITTGMEEIWHRSSPATISLWAYPSIDDDTLVALKRIEGVSEVEGFLETTLEWRLSPDDKWSPGGLVARDNYENQAFAKLSLLSGGWPHRKAFAVGQGCDVTFSIQQGNQVYIRVDDREYLVEVGGVIYDPNIQPPGFGGNAQFYTTRDRFGDLTSERNLNRILAGTLQYDEAQATAIADEMQDKLEKLGVESGGFAPPNGDRISAPDRHFFQDTMDGIFFILGLMAALALILGLFLVYNTIAAIINRQVNQIGIMKVVGAGAGRVLLVYLINVLIYGLLALVIALPLGVIGARVLGTFLLESFNADGSFAISPSAILAQVAIALLSPALACMIPIFAGARITVREAISTYGLRASSSLLARLLAKAQRIPRLVSLTISNTFRHKQRVLLTQITLVLSGVIFMTVLSAKDATVYTLDDLFLSILRFNVNFQLREPERIDRVETLALSQPGVKAAEMWSLEGATIRPVGQAESNDDEPALLFGVPLPTSLYGPQMRAGRWLQPGDSYAVVLNQKLARDANVGVGDTVTFDHSIYGESDWLVVGLLFDPVFPNSAHVPRDVVLREIHSVNKATTVWIQTVRGGTDSEVAIARDLREYYAQNQIELRAGSLFGQDTASEIVETILGQFATIVTLLAIMAVVIGMVGSIALSGTLSLNVLERTREIGVLRAIGASSKIIASQFIGEGLILGWLSWLVALPLSIPAGKLMVQGLGAAVDIALVYKYTPIGALYWLVIITVLSVAASWFPARGATRISVRESLTYE